MQNIDVKKTRQKDYIKEYFYIVVLAILFCLIVSIVTYDPNDPSTFQHSSFQNHDVSNYFGPFGASVADWSFQLFGLSVIVFLILFVIQLLQVFRRPITKTRVYLKLFGYPQLILFYLGFISGIKPLTNFRGVQFLTGGVIGNKIFDLFNNLLGTPGAIIVLLLGAFSSLTLCIGIKPLSSILWFLRFVPSKRTKNFARDISTDIQPISYEFLDSDTHTETVQSTIPYRTNQNVFLELISVLETNDSHSFKNLLQSKDFQHINYILPFGYGKINESSYTVFDLATLPNLLIEVEPECQKSQVVNILILSLMLNRLPTEVKLLLVDSQMIEFLHYDGIDHLLMPVITSPHKCLLMFEWLLEEVERRSGLLKQAKIRNFTSLKNQFSIPYIVIIVNELNDLMESIPYELENHLQKLQHKAHFVGIYLIFATQKSLPMLTTSMQAIFYNKMHVYSDRLLLIANDQEETIYTNPINISVNEIKQLTEKMRILYPYTSENFKLK